MWKIGCDVKSVIFLIRDRILRQVEGVQLLKLPEIEHLGRTFSLNYLWKQSGMLYSEI